MDILSDKLAQEMTWTLLRKGNLIRETESFFLVAAQMKVIRNNYVKAEIDNTKQNSKYLSLRVFGLLSSSLFPQRFGRYALQPSSGVCRTREPSRPLLNPRGSPVLISLAITGYKC